MLASILAATRFGPEEDNIPVRDVCRLRDWASYFGAGVDSAVVSKLSGSLFDLLNSFTGGARNIRSSHGDVPYINASIIGNWRLRSRSWKRCRRSMTGRKDPPLDAG